MHSKSFFSSFRFIVVVFVVMAQIAVISQAQAAPAMDTVVAAPLQDGAASVFISGLGNAPIGQNVSFSVSFDNVGASAGYGPFIDVILDTTGTDGIYPGTPDPANTYDGLGTTTITAKYLGAAIPAQDFFVVQFDAAGHATHPFALNSSGQKIVVNGTAGDKLVVVRLPFGSFSPTQPPAAIDFTVNMSNLADLNTPLSVQARGGFEFGKITPLNDWCCGDAAEGTLTPWSSGSVTPTLFTLTKTFSGPEGETATGPNFPRTYTVTATIAPGQTITGLQLTDTLPNNVQFVSMVTPAAASCPTLPSTTTPGGTLICNFASASGTVNMTFNFYVPRLDSASAAVLNASTGDDSTACNEAQVTAGTWDTVDSRDANVNTLLNPSGCENTFTPKSIAIQKGVTVIGGGDPAPGKVLEYTLNVQVSDYFVFNNVIATDVISDGQRFDTTFTPTIQVNGNGYTIATGSIAVANYTVDTSEIDLSDGPPATPENAATDGTTRLTFRISDEIDRTRPNGRMVGGCVDPVNGSPIPDCGTYNNSSTTATIKFRTVIQESFTDNYPTGDWSVDQGDVLDDQVNVTGILLNTAYPFTLTGNSEDDTSSASVTIGRGTLVKSIYAVNGSTTLPLNGSGQVIIKPDDTVTYRLKYVSATSDVENMYFEDFLPLPIFHADDPDDNGTAGPAWTFDPTASVASPASGVVKLGPDDTFYAYTAGAGTTGALSANTLHGAPATRAPKISIDPANNKLIVAYATYDDTRNLTRTIDLLFTVTVSDDPFADNLYLTNQALVYEGSTFNSPSSATSIVQLVLTEPVLVHKKGVIATNNTNATFAPAAVGPATVAFNAPGTSVARWSGIIDSPGLAANPINSNITGVDAGDLVSFAIVIENVGSSAKGAFDLTILDTLPAMYQMPSGGYNLRISNGDGSTVFTYTRPDGSAAVAGDLFGTGIEIVDPDPNNGACQSHTIGAGKNVIVITYDLQVRPDVTPGTQFNTATLVNYAGSDGGENHVPPTPPTDTASSTVLASLAKTLQGTEVVTANNSNTQVVIDELVTYRLTATVPEGSVPAASITDTLDAGLALVSCTSVTASAGVTTDLASGSNFSGACADMAVTNAQNFRFNLGNITNANRDNTVSETITVEYVAVVLNVAGNQGGILLNNEARFYQNTTTTPIQLGVAQNAPTVTVIEPAVTVAKAFTSPAPPATGDAGDSFIFTITLTNTSGVDAFEVTLDDTIPALMTGVTFTGVTDTLGLVTTSNFNLAGNTLSTITPFDFPVSAGRSIVLTFSGTISYSANPAQAITNTAVAKWSSMDGNVTNRSTHSGNDDERTGTYPVVQPNDYTSASAATFTVDSASSAKSIVTTSEAHTPETGDGSTALLGRPVTIGEIVRFRLVQPVPEGSSPNFQVGDFLPPGMTFMDDGTTRYGFVYDNTTTPLSSSSVGTLPVPAVTTAGTCQIANTTASVTCVLPDANSGDGSATNEDNDTYATGIDPYFKFGNLSNNDSDGSKEFVVIEFNALIDNTNSLLPPPPYNNNAGNTPYNTSAVYVNGGQNGSISLPVYVRIVEPGLAPTKTAIPASGDAGDVITYTLVFQNTGANASTAYDVTLTDTIPSKMTANLPSMTLVSDNGSGGICATPASNASAGNSINITYTSVPVGCTVTATYTATLKATVTAAEVLANAVTLNYSSLPGTNGTTSNGTGSSTPGGSGTTNGERVRNDTAHADVTVTNFGPVKSIFSTSAAHTTGAGNQSGTAGNVPDVTIGETLTYRLVTDIPEGTQTNLTVVDILPAGFTYVVGSPVMSFIANTGVTENVALAGADNGALPPTFAVPAYSGAGTVGVEVSGQTITFHLGDIVNNDSDSGAPNGTEQVVIDFTVRVNNDANTNNTNLKNNNYTVSTNNGSGVLTLRQTSNSVNARVVEPLPTIVKAANDLSWEYAQEVTFTLTVTNPNPPVTPAATDSLTTAFEIVVTDVIPASLTYVPASITTAGNWVADASAAPTLTWTCAQANPTACNLPVNSTAAFTYRATVDTPDTLPVPTNGALTGSATATNTATMTWTSLPGVDANERTGSGGVINDYTRTSSQTGSLAYYALGNRVWFDTNNNSAINFTPSATSESEQPAGTKIGVNDVILNLYKDNGSGTYLNTGLTQTTANGGYYLFDNLGEGNYIVVIPSTEFAAGEPLFGYWSSGTSINNTGGLSETAAPDPDNNTDSDDNGLFQTSGAYSGGVASLPITLGPGNEPASESDVDATAPGTAHQGTLPDNRANMTADFGFYRVGVGDIVWLEVGTVNGSYPGPSADTLINGATVKLFTADGITQLNVNANGVWLGTSGAGSIVTGPSLSNPGWANGYYQFTGLPAGRYVVEVTGPTGTVSTIDTFDAVDSATPSANTNNNDNGIGDDNVVKSAISAGANNNAMNLVPGGSGHTVTYTTGTSFNPTLDFGFTSAYSIGNRVWFDTNNSSAIDFTAESEQPAGTRIGVNGVTVQLYAANGSGAPTGSALRTTTTANGGYYLFDSIAAGDYVVVLPASNFTGAGALVGYWSSATERNADGAIAETVAALANSDTDSDDNGTRQTAGTFNNAVISSVVTIGGTEPIDEHLTSGGHTADVDIARNVSEAPFYQGTQPDSQSNMTVDFGFYRVEVGNLIFTDVNRDGLYGPGDTLLDGIAVELLSSDGTTLSTTTSNPSGIYQFAGQPKGTYIIRVTAPTGTYSTLDTGDTVAPNDNTDPNDNFDSNDNGLGVLGGDVDSAPVLLNPGAAQNFNTVTYATGTTHNPTMDFGFAHLFSLGNRVWFDTNNDGLVAAGTEVGVPNVRVELYRDSGSSAGVFDSGDTFLTSDDTDATGYYRFDGLWPANYIVVIPADNFRNIGAGDNVAGDPLAGYLSSGTQISGAGVISDTFSPAPDSPASVDNDDNGASTFASNSLRYVSAQAVTIESNEIEPTGELDPTPNPDASTGEAAVDNRSDRTVDFGFYRMQLSNQIFNDLNNDGMFTVADSVLSGAVVQLYASNGTTEIRVGPDGILGTSDDTTGGVTTGVGGTYLFSGLPKGDYIVKVTPPAGSSTVDTGNSSDSATPNNNVDHNDNGLGIATGQVSSNVVTLTPGVAGASTTVTNATATTLNPSMDFGFVPLYSLGNRVWFDTDNNSAINGSEVGVNNVRVELYLDNGDGVYSAGDVFQSFTTTSAGGYYRFDNLNPGNYVVLIPPTQFVAGGALNSYWSSGTSIADNGTVTDTTANDPDDLPQTDSDDNGITTLSGNAINYVSARAVTLGPGLSEPTNDNEPVTNPETGEAPNDQSNRTVDFGFYRTEVSNQIFWDTNGDGLFGAGDTTLPGATVKIYNGSGTTEILVGPDGILGTADDAAGGIQNSPADGTYLFSGLPAGNFIVRVTPPAGFNSTVDTGNSGDSATPNNNIDHNDNGVGVTSGEVSSMPFALVPGVVNVSNTVTNSAGTTLNPSLDFGFQSNTSFEFSIGNRVWFDTDNNGSINGAEVGVNGVRVDLYRDNGGSAGVWDGTDAFVSFATTDSSGHYRFDDLSAGNYVVVILPGQFASGAPLDGYWSSGTSISSAGAITDGIGPDVDTVPADSDDNGVTTLAGSVVDYVASRAVTLGPTANEPVGETDALPNPDTGEEPDAQSNRTVDFGFYRIQVSNQIFVDVNNDGVYNSGDSAFTGARVQIYSSNGTTEINVGPDGILGTADDAANGVVTLADGLYLFSGLPAGNYIIKVTPPVGYLSTVDMDGDTNTPNNNVNNNDNGIGVSGGQVSSNPVSLTPGVSGASTTVTNSTGTTHNPSMDFGFNATNGFLKTIVGTNQTFTTGANAAIGEIVTYQITMNLAAGVPLNNVLITDRLDRGLAFVDCTSLTINGVPSVCSPVVSSITDPGDVAGNPANPGRQVVFNIGAIPAPAADTSLVLQYRAIVLDVVENQNSGALNNSATVTSSGTTFTSSAPNLNVVEPDMAIDKSAIPTSGVPLGTPIQFTLTINHTTPQSTADAFDVVVTDVLPSTLEYIPCSVTYSGWLPTSPAAPAYCPGTTNALTFTWDTFPRGQVAVINFSARLIGTPATNSASVAWTSLDIDPGAGGLPQQLSIHNAQSTERWYDPNDNVDIYAVSDSITINEPAALTDTGESSSKEKLPVVLPATGFAPNVVTILPEQPADKSYTATDVWLEIPSLGIKMPIVGVPLVDGDWDLSWLAKEAGWLDGTAFPGWEGNSALTGHVTLPNGKPGPFAGLGKLNWGDTIIIHAYGEVYTYEVRENRTIKPYITSVLKHEEDAWLTLITCKTYIESTNTYADRTAVRAVLVKVQKDTTTSTPSDRR